jgi:hypothetical protein
LDVAAHSTSNAMDAFQCQVSKLKDESAIETSNPLILYIENIFEISLITCQSLKSLPFATFPRLSRIFNCLAICNANLLLGICEQF